ncbi:unnamed protein product [Eruca vesicaria subsp. sativa]|uniref:Ribulose-1,5-bisphosphate carboxylase small subunit N-terminal domain-containing protein n=1 Tax=Eruca vesicaria subsp. sativa TaxID=29727 RepID=A0ABC8LIH0_ERUVS|nr:unnamed protein product [Eruca vesicaria subsp. sativa]
MTFCMLSSATIASSLAHTTMVPPFIGLKSYVVFPVIRKANSNITSIANNGGRINCMKVWPLVGKKKFETMPYLPTLPMLN